MIELESQTTIRQDTNYIYFLSDSIFVELIHLDIDSITSELYFKDLSNDFIDQQFFVKRGNHYLAGRDSWGYEAEIELKRITKDQLIFTTTRLESSFAEEYRLKKIIQSDSINFEFNDFYKSRLNSFINDTMVVYGLFEDGIWIQHVYQGRIMEYVSIELTKSQPKNLKNGYQLYIGDNNRLYSLRSCCLTDLKATCSGRLEDVVYH
ncbi:MAG: hypothetical protein H6582_01125 [Crocinitomicaceae bacterium]|nr:hypothetical protein [Crocinitomicaceae bacterium]